MELKNHKFIEESIKDLKKAKGDPEMFHVVYDEILIYIVNHHEPELLTRLEMIRNNTPMWKG